jgi:hypothetical protein
MYIEKPENPPYPGCEGKWLARHYYQERKKDSTTFGYFKCNYCDKAWTSAFAYKSYKQGCKECERRFPPAYLWVNSNK